jgi:glycerol-3-phosphate acyltransferase PlsY
MRLAFIVGPFLVLTIAGIALWRRYRSLSSLLVAIGFAVAFLHLIASTFQSVGYALMTHPEWLWTRYLGNIGLWIAAVGFLWHVRQVSVSRH